jgi:hypothetical protein
MSQKQNQNLFDTNTANYSLVELMAIVDVNDLDPQEIVDKTNKYINRFKERDPIMAIFFRKIQSQLLQYASGLEPQSEEDEYYAPVEGFSNMQAPDAEYPEGEKQTNDWYENEYLQQSPTNKENQNQNNKITQRKQKIQVYGNTHNPMNREQLGVNNTYNLPVAQDVLNPNLKNVITRFVNLDSQFRQYSSGGESSSTDYTLDLSDTLKNVLSMKLYSYQIPYSWYVIDITYGNTCFWITDTMTNNNITISIEPGNYTTTQFQDALNSSLTAAGFTGFMSATPITFDSKNGLLKMNLYGGVYTDPNDSSNTFTITETTILTFYDFSGKLQCNPNSCLKTGYLNQTLGWVMGFRVPYINVLNAPGNTGTAIVDLNGTKYLILVIDDYNQNHVNNGLVSITEFNSNLKLPNYYSPDLPYTCVGPNVTNTMEENSTNSGLLISDKLDVNYTSTQVILPSAPRTLTQSQIYTINEINKNQNPTNYKAKAPTTPDILAIVPIKVSGVSTGTLLVEFSGSLQDNIRTYFGPVNIERMRVKLLDDKGNILNLNGGDWCVTLICECLYQY